MDIKERRELIQRAIQNNLKQYRNDYDKYPTINMEKLMADTLLKELSSLGLVFKVEGELPSIELVDTVHDIQFEYAYDEWSGALAQELRFAGYSLTAPIEEK